jgi:arylsulfatase A-like enzyme
VSILPTLLGEPQSLDRDLIWVRREGGKKYQGQDYYAIRRGQWKLLQNDPFERYQLFNLSDDPLEQTDVASLHPSLVDGLSAALRRHVQQAAQVPWQPQLPTEAKPQAAE